VETYIIQGTGEFQQQGFGNLATIDTIVIAKVFARHRGGIDIDGHGAVVGTLSKDVLAESDEVIKCREHLCNIINTTSNSPWLVLPSRKSTASALKIL